MASTGSILGGAFRLFRERPGAILAWGAINLLESAVIAAGTSYALTGTLSVIPDPAAFIRGGQPPEGVFGTILLVYLGSLLVNIVLANAVFRAVLRPEASSFASLRLGMDELRMLGLGLMFLVAGFIGMLLAQLLMMLIATFLGWIAGEDLAALVLLALMLGYFAFLVWISVRLSLIFPVTFYRRRFSIDAGCELGRGRFWAVFSAYLAILLSMMVVGAALMWAMAGDYFTALLAARGDPAQMQRAASEFAQRQLDMPATARITRMILAAFIGIAGLTLGIGVIASAARELLIDRGEDGTGADSAQDWSEAEI